ncbi:MAG: SLC13 family permease [Defluviitaleaceae bacterium]|nr:SLC13 family permease [Defluviitaleaceae bacterium]
MTQIFDQMASWLQDPAVVALIIIACALVLYITELIPIAVTSVLACLALAIFGVITPATAFSGFANDMVFLIVGMVIVGNALFETGIAQMMGKGIIRIVGGNEKLFVVVLILIATIPAAFLSNTAAAAMMLPVAAAAVAASNGKFSKKRTFMVVGIAAVTSGGLTLVGSTPQLIAQGLLEDGGHELMGFFDLAIIGAPIIGLLLLYYLTIGRKILAKTAEEGESADEDEALKVQEVERSPIKIAITLGVLVFCIIGFVLDFWSLGVVAMLGASICVATSCISIKRVYSTMSWNTVVVIGGSLGISAGLAQSGAGTMIAEGMVSLLGENVSPWLVTAGLSLIAVVLGNFMSATATAALLIPITISIAVQMGFDVRSVVIAVVIASNISYATPVSTPPMTMTLSAGYRFIDYIKFGGLFNILAYLLAIILFPLVLNL